MKQNILIFFYSLLILFPVAAQAHKPSDSYLNVSVQGQIISIRWDIAIKDLEYVLNLDTNSDSQVTWGEVRTQHQKIAQFAMSALKISRGEIACQIQTKEEQKVEQHTDGSYTVLYLEAICPENADKNQLFIDYNLFFDTDPTHRGLLNLDFNGETFLAVFTPEKYHLNFSLNSSNKITTLLEFINEGVWHIWTGFDHILFLLALLLPSVLSRRDGRWEPIASFNSIFWNITKVVTAFTIAHSITLSLASLQIVDLPSRFVESTIALSVALAALNNIRPFFKAERLWSVAFVFGLIHGFGFAEVLKDLGLEGQKLLLTLFSYNFGVELGQLAIVSIFLPLAYFLRHTSIYRRLILFSGSTAIFILSMIWFVERAFNLSIT